MGWVAVNSIAWLGLFLAGYYLGNADYVVSLTIGIPSALVFGITYTRGFPLLRLINDKRS